MYRGGRGDRQVIGAAICTHHNAVLPLNHLTSRKTIAGKTRGSDSIRSRTR
jgi:hypothetical protein